MPCQILVSNNSGFPKGYILAVLESNHAFSPNETLKEWVKSGNAPESWGRSYTLVKITDKSKAELQYLLDPFLIYATNPPESDGRKYSFIEPAKDSLLYKDLLDDGEAESTWAIASPYLIERAE